MSINNIKTIVQLLTKEPKINASCTNLVLKSDDFVDWNTYLRKRFNDIKPSNITTATTKSPEKVVTASKVIEAPPSSIPAAPGVKTANVVRKAATVLSTTNDVNDVTYDFIEKNKPMISKLLSYPITLRRHWSSIRDVIESKAGNKNEKKQQSTRIVIAGARAEASLPNIYWDELTKYQERDEDYDISFIGFDVDPKKLMERQTKQTRPNKMRFNYYKGPLTKDHRIPDLYVMYNSGIGHPREKQYWKESIDILLQNKVPILGTSFNKVDFERDVHDSQLFAKAKEMNRDVRAIGVNPFADMIEDFEGAKKVREQETKTVTTNSVQLHDGRIFSNSYVWYII